jgi:hypothetical protein
MMAPQKSTDKLRGSPKLTPDQLSDLCIQALIIMPELLKAINDSLVEILDQNAVIALYCERAGMKTGLLTKEDMEGGENGSGNGSTAGVPADIQAEGNPEDKGHAD